jgi:hypothetical protein
MEQHRMPSRGLGDDIARITRFTRIDSLAKKIAKVFGQEDCGCSKRQEYLNDTFPRKLHLDESGKVINYGIVNTIEPPSPENIEE